MAIEVFSVVALRGWVRAAPTEATPHNRCNIWNLERI